MTNPNNPLSQYFRIPGMHVELPSKGNFNDPSEFKRSMNGDFEVFPMTAADETYAKNPDGLLNGHSIERILKSCVPGVADPKKLPTQDVDYLLLAIKKCSYGRELKLEVSCPKCNKEHAFSCDIDELLSDVKPFEESYEVRISDEMVINLRPYTYESSTKLNMAAFEEAKLFASVLDVEFTEEQKGELFSNSLERITDLNLERLADCVISVSVPNGVVTDYENIKEFIKNTDRVTINKIKEVLKTSADCGLNKKIDVTCPTEGCGHEYQTDLIFDPAHFFA
ncbi:baseplate hub [Agrobacterium phage Atu_ph07]|uniref:Baseplate hub subunit n=1 Tax=Agrobacterium phage Atu_ph07 TaxID=2024264 RepID=A0A223W0A4_9CAUD|nr:baseplate hub [Agrobacterium phage Atu_ph07]ASV44759.1 hypothetical protein [Agrobacterium phage Atu_ph07]